MRYISALWGNVKAYFNTFLKLLDTPLSYTDQGGKVVVVKEDETGLEFIDAAGMENVQSDWSQADSGADDYIKNKPEIPDDYVWNLHSSEQVTGYLDEPENIQVDVEGSGAVDVTIPAGAFQITALNDEGETTGGDSPEFNIYENTPEEEGAIVFTWDAVEGATKYRFYHVASETYEEILTNSFDFINFTGSNSGTPPEESTAISYQSPFEIENEDTVDFIGEGIDVETKVDEEDSTRKEVKLIKQKSDWDEIDPESPNFIENKPSIPDEYENKDWTVITAKDIEAGTAQDYVIVMKARESFTIDSLVYECDDGTLTGCAVKIDGVAVTGLSSLSVSTSETETSATGGNTVSAGNRITFHTSTGYTGTPTMINIQLNFTR